MDKLSLRFVITKVIISSADRIKTIKLFLLVALFCGFSNSGFGAVTITPATSGTLICSNKAIGGTSPSFTSLGPINVTEGANSDLNGPATDVLVLNAPAGWQFNATLPSFSYITGSNITSVTGTITSTTLTINVTTNDINGADQFTISGLQVQATATTSLPGYIYASSIIGIAGITSGTSGSNFGNLSLTPMITPSVIITPSPSGPICPGTSVTFTPAPTNGGPTPTYQWFLNGTNVAIGASYTNAAITNGSTVVCSMTSTAACVVPTVVNSNTITTTVNPAPAAITGNTTTCPAFTTSLADVTVSGAWSSINTAVATIDASGVVTGVAAGTATISYTAAGCAARTTVYVNATPVTPILSPASSTICNGSSVAISSAGTPLPAAILTQNFNSGVAPWTVDNTGSIGTLPGSEWKSCGDGYINEYGTYHTPDNTGFAMTNSDTSGSASFTSSKLISPSFSLAGYSSATLSFQQSYAYWVSGDYNVSLDISTNSGSSWTTLQSFIGNNIGSITSFVSQSFSLNAYLGQPNVMIRFYYNCHYGYYWAVDNILITGVSSVVNPTWTPVTYLFSDAALSTPYVSGTSLATVYVHPTTVSTATAITYTATATIPGCSASGNGSVNINPPPAVITGANNVCVGTTASLSNAVPGGTWTSSNTSVATIGSSSGVVSGLAPGTTVISYILGTGCAVSMVVTANISPAAITGQQGVCLGGVSTLSNAQSGGTWTSNNIPVAAIGSSSGIVSGVTTGTAAITYSLGLGCTSVAIVSVNPLPLAITGTMNVCVGLTTSLADATGGGTWTSGSTSVAGVGSGTGVVTGIIPGTAIITYTATTNCSATATVTVNPLSAITGTMTVCAGLSTTLSNAQPAGTWTSGNIPVATVGSSSGIVTGVTAGTAKITYLLATGCAAVTTVTVNPLPANITGTPNVCVGLTTSLNDATGSGTWTSNNSSVGTIGSGSGVVTGVAAGVVLITYTISTGCMITTPVMVNPLLAITGTTAVCAGLTTTLNNAVAGGTWSSSVPGVGSVGVTSGIFSAIASGTTIVNYILPTGCTASVVVTVNALPAPITGTLNVCVGLTTSLANTTSGGSWTSGNLSAATVGSGTGVVSGIASGFAGITYTLPTGCIAATSVTVNPLPAAITGTQTVCAGLTTTFSNASGGGSWTSNNIPIATIGSSSGIATGVLAGVAGITYTLSTGCVTGIALTVNPLPATITGTVSVCVGLTTTLANATSGGTWISGNTSVATIVPGSGILTGVVAGTSIVTYMLTTGCISVTTVTVNPLPATITGPGTVCAGLTISLADITTGGAWSSSNGSFATVGSGTGVVSGIAQGVLAIVYTLPTGCLTSKNITVNPLPAIITGAAEVCQGLTVTLSDATGTGSWTSSNTSTAGIGLINGVVTGAAAGSVIITYTLATGCIMTAPFTVDPLPAVITGPSNVCSGLTVTVSDATTGGSWTSSNPGTANIGSATGIITGFSSGAAFITYTLPTGCNTVYAFTVNPLPAVVTGSSGVCVSYTTTLNDITTGGSWTSGNAAVATIGTGSGIVSGVAPGVVIMTYILPTGCLSTKAITVNALPSAITGSTSICQGLSSSLSDASTGGTWTSSNTGIAVVGTGSGVVTGVSPGAALITYTVASGCLASIMVTVSPIPSVIAGTAMICAGAAGTLSNTVAGGTWNSGDPSVAAINITSGIFSGVAAGTAVISYTLAAGCTVTTIVTINPVPLPVTGTPGICLGSVTVLNDLSTGGSWISGNMSVAGIGSSSGLVSAFSVGTSTITYTFPTGCLTMFALTVNSLPAAVTGASTVCVGYTTTLNDVTLSGSWTSGNTSVAAVGSGTGVVTGLTTGLVSIVYTLPSGCSASKIITVNATPSAITGISNICQGLTTTMSIGTTGGSWTSGNTSIATVGSATGIVTGVAAGITAISYSLSTGCASSIVLTVSPLPSAISGSANLCIGYTSTLGNTIAGGTWSSGNAPVATVGSSSGIVSGIAAGLSMITYTLPAGCSAYVVVTVNSFPSAISGTPAVCIGATTTLGNTVTGGTWSSGATGIATINSSTGVITGIAAGTANITYGLGSGCNVTLVVTVNAVPVISGATTVCLGSTATLTNTSTGGTWTSSNTSVVIVGAASGIMTGFAVNTATITYTLSPGCVTSTTITVNPTPASITGLSGVCVGLNITLSDPSTGGSWVSGNPAIASVGSSTGIVTGLSSGGVSILYKYANGCAVSKFVSVSLIPGAISGALAVCQGAGTTLSDATTGGTWTSSSTSVATIGSGNGIVAALTSGTSMVTYTLGASCIATAVLTVNPLPSAISGSLNVCSGFTTTLSDAAASGTWTCGNLPVATIGSASGVVSGIVSGTALITYTLPTGCLISSVVTVNTTAAISGITAVCVGTSATLSDATAGGTWLSGNTSVATIGLSDGVVTGVATGAAPVTYVSAVGCLAVGSVTVNSLPSAISGSHTVCVGLTTTLADASTGGTWSSGNTAVASIGSASGIVSGITNGTTTITYRVATGCMITAPVTVNPLPAAISGPPTLCVGLTTTLSDASVPGTWSSGSISVATVGAASGIVLGASAGTAAITYTLGTGCITSAVVTVNTLLPVTGTAVVCAGLTTTLSNAVAGGSWTSGNLSVATVGSGSGVVTGIAGGTAIITYTYGSGCTVTAIVTVNPLAPIAGIASVCIGLTTTLNDPATGGNWSSSNTSIATVVSASGVVTGISAGTASITYLLATGCSANIIVTVNPLAPITGTTHVCAGLTITLNNVNAGGTWTSSNTGIATAGAATGIVTGVTAGTASITYLLPTSCQSVFSVTVDPLPAAISGITNVCAGLTVTLSDITTGGTWSSSNTSVATIGALTGIVSGTTVGTTTITYMAATGCINTTSFTVNPLPPAISGISSICVGNSITLTDAATSGSWSTSAANITVGSATGIVTGIAAGAAGVTYTLSTGCIATAALAVNPLPPAITGAGNVCMGLLTTLGDATSGGIWSSGNTSVATIGASSGVVATVSAGTAAITYSLSTGCFATKTVTVNPLPAVIVGPTHVCAGSTITLTNIVAGGTWTSSNIGVAPVGAASGIITGAAAGTAMVTYLLATGCIAATPVTVNPLPAAITGITNVCAGLTVTLNDVSSGGTWAIGSSSGAATVAAATGVVTGVAAGTATVTYSLVTGCLVNTTITVNPLPLPITGASSLCAGYTTTFTDVTTGGTWSSSGTASVGAATGIVTGISAGVSTITYTLATGCKTTAVLSVNATPSAITGIMNVCAGSTTLLADAAPGGSWSIDPASAAIATISAASGWVTGISAGTAVVTYSLGSGCAAMAVVSVNPLPSVISGVGSICNGNTTTLTNTAAGGTWSSGNIAVAYIGLLNGVVTGISPGTAAITYILPTGCSVTSSILVNPVPSAISGTAYMCAGAQTTLSDVTSGGTWSSPGYSSIATVNVFTGVVTGVSAGTAMISYVVGTGCYAAVAITVNPLPAPIGGTANACVGETTSLSNSMPGGTWVSSNTNALIGSSSGFVTGVTLGTSVITYTLPTGCSISGVITVNPVPAAITGASGICQGSAIILSDVTSGGVWTSSNTSIATVVSAVGYVIGVSSGVVNIYYSLATGCSASTAVTVNPIMPITGTAANCIGDVTTFADGVPGGTWSSSTTGVATVGATTGVVIPIAAGTAVIRYALASGCMAYITVTVNPLPISYLVVGGGSYCVGSAGVHIGLDGSAPGVIYKLVSGTTVAGTLTGTGAPLDFGVYATPGTYTVLATNPVTGCNKLMPGSAVVTAVPYTIPSVSISTGFGDTLCAATLTTFTAVTAYGGSTPLYQWKVNGVVSGAGASLTRVSLSGDVISCRLTSSAGCLLQDTAFAAVTAIVVPTALPVVIISASPDDTVCTGAMVSFTASATYGGGAPFFSWMKNSTPMASGPVFSYTPADGDIIFCKMASNFHCRIADTVVSNSVDMTVLPMATPVVAITANPGLNIVTDQSDTLTAIVVNGGAAPAYQWYINALPVSGATTATFIFANFANNDSVSCMVTSSGPCGGIASSANVLMNVGSLEVGHTVANNGNRIKLLPNPNNGEFVVRGQLISSTDDEVLLSVYDVLGQKVYEKKALSKRGRINETVLAGSSLANGIYLLYLSSSTEHTVMQFVISK